MWSSFQSKSKKSFETIFDSNTNNHSKSNSDSSTPAYNTSPSNEKNTNKTSKKYHSNQNNTMESHKESNSTFINEDDIQNNNNNNISTTHNKQDKVQNETKTKIYFQMDENENQLMDETNLDEYNHNKNHYENESLHDLYDEISISTKDSLGPTAFIEPIFDLQATTTKTTKTTKTGKTYDFKSISDSECIQMYHYQDDAKEINECGQKEDGVDDNDKDNTTIKVEFDEQHIIEKNQQDQESKETCEKLDNEKEGVRSSNPKEEASSSKSSSSSSSETLSYDSFQRIVKRAFLRSKVEQKRQNLSSKISILNAKSVDFPIARTPSHDHEDNDTNQGIEEEVKQPGCNDVSISDSNGVNEDVFLGLGKLMYKEEDDQGQQQQQHHQPSEESGDDPHVAREANPFISWNQISTRTLFHVIIVMSFVMNVCKYLPFFESQDESINETNVEETNTLSKDAMNLFLVYSKLSMVQDEMKTFHFEKQQRNDFMLSSLKLGFVIFIILTSFVVSSLVVVNKKNPLVRNESCIQSDFISPSTNKKSLQRELSSLDKKNIFPSTMNTVTVQKDGTMKEVKRSMRFSPEVKRFTSPPLEQKSSSATTTTRQRPKKTYPNGMKSPGMFSPRFKKMKPVKEEH